MSGALSPTLVFLNRGPVPGPGIIYTGPREVFLEFVILIF